MAVVDVRAEAVGVEAGRGQDGLADGGQVGSFPVVESAFAAGEGEEGFDEVFLLVVGGEQLFGGGPPCLRAGVGVVERDLQQVALGGEGGA